MLSRTLRLAAFAAVILLAISPANAQVGVAMPAAAFAPEPQNGFLPPDSHHAASDKASEAILLVPPELPHMAPELALAAFERSLEAQRAQGFSYSAVSTISADLPETRQHAEYEVERRFAAPRSLKFKALHFVGDAFVKTNVIVRLLQAEVDRVEKQQFEQTALNSANYKISYKQDDQVDGRSVHVFQVKPRAKQPGLFKGKIYLDVYSGNLLRAEGTLVKSPSFFIKKIEFVQDYAEIAGHLLPTHLHSVAKARVLGRTVVDVATHDYQPLPQETFTEQASAASSGR